MFRTSPRKTVELKGFGGKMQGMESETCQRCGVESPDLRTLMIDCLLKLEETGLPFAIYDHIASDGRKFYALRICKECRHSFTAHLVSWFKELGGESEAAAAFAERAWSGHS